MRRDESGTLAALAAGRGGDGIHRTQSTFLNIDRPTARAFETRRTTLPISQQIQTLRRSVPISAVNSFGEKGPKRELNGPSCGEASQQVW
jgi:hypothetical protein